MMQLIPLTSSFDTFYKIRSLSDSFLTTKKAFTLVELLIGLTVFSILLMFAIPAFRNMMLNNRLLANNDLLVNSLNYARNIALNDSMSIKVCPFNSANSTTCGSDWGAGWIVVSQPSLGTPMLLKSQQNATSNPITITATNASVTFDSHGLAITPSNFKLCDSRGGAFARSITVLATGYVQAGNSMGVAVWNNSSLTCP